MIYFIYTKQRCFFLEELFMKEFFSGVKKEAKRTRWPKGKEMFTNSVICLTMIAFFALFFYAFDVLFAFLRGLL